MYRKNDLALKQVYPVLLLKTSCAMVVNLNFIVWVPSPYTMQLTHENEKNFRCSFIKMIITKFHTSYESISILCILLILSMFGLYLLW